MLPDRLEINPFEIVNNMPYCFRIAIINYTDTQVYCLGYFRKPTEDEIKRHSMLPFAMFEPAEPGFWRVTFYSLDEVLNCIEHNAVPNYGLPE
jgi:hypothetical protein